MKLTELKAELQEQRNGLPFVQVIVDLQDAVNTQAKDYPLLFFNFNTFKGEHSRTDETATITAYALGNYDAGSKQEHRTRLEVWEELKAALLGYITLLNNTSSKVRIDEAFEYELFDAGVISVDSELAVGAELSLTLYC